MKKKLLTVITALVLVVATVFTLCACSSYGGVKKAFENNGYREVEATEEQKKAIIALVGEDYDSKVGAHSLQKSEDDSPLSALNFAVILEFKSNDEMVNTLKETLHLTDDDLKAAYDALQKSDLVNGNCFILSGSIEAYKIFKESK